LYPERSGAALARLAHHAWQGGAWARAVVYLHLVGLAASARSAPREALTSLDRALQAVASVPDTAEAKQRAIDILLDMREPLIALERIDDAVKRLRTAEALARNEEERGRLAGALTGLCQALRLAGDSDGAVRAGQDALALAAQLGDAARRLEAAYRLGQAHVVRGNYIAAAGLLRETVEGREATRAGLAAGPSGDSLAARAWLAIALAHLGRFAEGIEQGELAIRLAEAEERPREIIAAHAALGAVCLEKGDHFRAALLLERALTLARSWNIADWSSGAASGLAYARMLAGRLSEAFATLQASDTPGHIVTALGAESLRLRYLAHGLLAAGRMEEAAKEAERALEVARHGSERGHEAWLLHLLGDVSIRSDPPDAAMAEARYRAALDLADQRGMRPLVAHCHLALGLLHRRAGDRARTDDHLTTATAMFREMDMRFWLEAVVPREW
ncbi:MAG: hypothetical protein ACREJR_07550, partial [Candidatus Rokuibacteriota bacterium]